MNYYAHSKKDHSIESWQTLEDHMGNVAQMAAEFADIFDAGQWAKLVGQYHDLGKGTKGWQAWIRRENNIKDAFEQYYSNHPKHADVGAKFLFDKSKDVGKLLAYAIAGHHAGMPDWTGEKRGTGMEARMKKDLPEIDFTVAEPDFPKAPPLTLEKKRCGFQFQFFTRMLFSCLVDADWLDTEHFLNVEKSTRRGTFPLLNNLYDVFWKQYNTMINGSDPHLNVNKQRKTVKNNCLEAATMEPGIFSLTVPTGGGKTLASMAFALEHAKKHGKKRIIYVIPFTSIIEQNSHEFRRMLGQEAILEHHCNFIPDQTDWQTRLAAENWDAPIIVTTNVQFFDSFYANQPSRCRKLHNVANSIIIFDEVQAIPVEKLKPCIEVIRELSLNYKATCLLCTATQPSIGFSDDFQSGLKDIREIVQDVPALFKNMKRTEETFIGELTEEDLAEKLTQKNQVLCIVNTRSQALNVYQALQEGDENFHLSALMHPKHRSCTLEKIRKRLKTGQICRVVSTQLIEAGVDVDFPCVYRVIGGIDSIAQAAGRCNREGKNSNPQPVYVFDFPPDKQCRLFRMAAESAKKLVKEYEGHLTSPDCVNEYFADYFWKNEQNMDADDIAELCRPAISGCISFKKMANFHMINSNMKPIIVAIDDEAKKLVDQLQFVEKRGAILRKLQQYTVQVYCHQLKEIREWLEPVIDEEVYVLRHKELYKKTGLHCSSPQGEAFIL